MKLYATTTSERATKGQGGNDYLTTDFLVGDRQIPVLSLSLKIIDSNTYYLRITDYEKDKIIYAEQRKYNIVKQKAEKQKTAIDYTCPKCKTGQAKPNFVWCDNCINQ